MFRENVAALIKYEEKYLACFRADYDSCQNVQGGIEITDHAPLCALNRELQEELGLCDDTAFAVVYQSTCWRRYFFPKNIQKTGRFHKMIGQEQLWFLIDLKSLDAINLGKSSGEFKKVELMNLEKFIKIYSHWKLAPFYDFCRELGLLFY
jgi:hypothetical protein